MNIGKTAALLTAAAGAVVFGGTGAGATGLDNSIRQSNDCDSKGGLSIGGAPASSSECLNFAQVFGDPHGVVQRNDCDTTIGTSANVTIIAPPGGSEVGSHCTNIAVSAHPSKVKTEHRGAYGHGRR
ncbi:hypothetical protein [Streptomyces sparsogenes]|uniref:Uncharacterized protein n=1 Tax=Streptomyces sparsogenes DSM 40356 TaxID=1331668 RepID=A0A1R1S6T3_9ACTN|nr:hypothetical protein [Streptomyces sparsogenes]OMI34031.1 hypothetical protein SPAR_38520 [Streptomyces sparsogenes DSM 40356]